MKTPGIAIVLLSALFGMSFFARAAEKERERPKSPEVQDKERADREQAAKRVKELEVKGGLLVKEGKFEEAEAIRREVNELKAKLGIAEQPRPAPASPQSEMERRMMHVRAAIQNLHAAGMPDQAQRIEREADHMMREFREQLERREQESRRHAQRERAEHRQIGEGPRPDDIRAELGQLRREVQELRELVKRLAERR